MHYLEVPPSPPLRRFVKCFWYLGAEGTSAAGSTEKIVPDGSVELILNLGDPFVRHGRGDQRHDQALELVAGHLDEYIVVEPTGRVDMLGVRFRSAGAGPFLRLPLAELTGAVVALDDLDGSLVKELRDAVDPAGDLPARIAGLERVLLRRLAGTRDADALVELAVKRLEQSDGCVSVDDLAREFGISHRQLQRRFQEHVGIGPKALGRTLRFQRVFRTVEEGVDRRAWAAVAVECGYYDHAHFIKEFKRFAGERPPEFFAEEHLLARLLTSRGRVPRTPS